MSAAKWGLDNLVVIIDRNGVQLDGPVDQIMSLKDLALKLRAFGIYAVECDGHDVEALIAAIQNAIDYKGTAAVIAETVKGKGVSYIK